MMDYLRGTDWEHFPEAEIKRQEMLILEPRFPTPKRQVLAELQASKG